MREPNVSSGPKTVRSQRGCKRQTLSRPEMLTMQSVQVLAGEVHKRDGLIRLLRSR